MTHILDKASASAETISQNTLEPNANFVAENT